MRRLHLFWPHLLLRLALARANAPQAGDPTSTSWSARRATEPIVVGGRPWSGGLVLDANGRARGLGIRRGMSLAAAQRLVPETRFLEPHPEADRAALEAVFERLAAFSPSLAGTSEPDDPAFGFIEVGIEGLELLWGEERILAARLASAVEGLLPGRPNLGIAGTRFAATVAAVLARPGVPIVVPPGGEAAFLAPLPATILTSDPEARARLLRFGLRRVDQVAALPRSAVVARFGPEGVRLHARAVGEEVEPGEIWRRPERAALGLDLEPAVDRLEALRFVLHRLVVGLVEQVAARGRAAASAELRLRLDPRLRASDPGRGAIESVGAASSVVPGVSTRGWVVTVRQVLPEPTADGEAIERLLVARLERHPPAAAVERLELELDGLVPDAGQQLELFEPQRARRGRLAWQLARIAVEFGADRVLEAEVLDPEASWAEARSRWRSWSGRRGAGVDGWHTAGVDGERAGEIQRPVARVDEGRVEEVEGRAPQARREPGSGVVSELAVEVDGRRGRR